jgi:2-methylisocitrate lyase-like PEP mutase family enzyme
MNIRYGDRLRQVIREGEVLPFIGGYDVFSASIAAKHYDALFVSGFSFTRISPSRRQPCQTRK